MLAAPWGCKTLERNIFFLVMPTHFPRSCTGIQKKHFGSPNSPAGELGMSLEGGKGWTEQNLPQRDPESPEESQAVPCSRWEGRQCQQCFLSN